MDKLLSFSPPPPSFPVPNKPPRFCGCKATRMLTYFTMEEAQPYVDVKQHAYLHTYFTTEEAQPYVDVKKHAYLLILPQKKLNPTCNDADVLRVGPVEEEADHVVF